MQKYGAKINNEFILIRLYFRFIWLNGCLASPGVTIGFRVYFQFI
ncbi:unannotated protein [freshwater metagenome]|uniref:Unannotated protein n=1 Tax=freshwater metagenome TaxID=449393 RepID=A0A6J7R8D8_9ZZZZ